MTCIVSELMKKRQEAHEAGFTLVELAIVLVIIGLIIGGVLVGQDLIKSAEIRATVQQIEGYNAAVNTFRGRFRGIPGDIRNAMDFFDATTWPSLVNGDGDRVLEACVAASIGATGLCDTSPAYDSVATETTLSGEILQFWHHLSAAELVPGFYDGVSFGGTSGTADSGTPGLGYPIPKLDRNGIGVYGAGGRNYFQIGAIDNGTDETYDIDPSLTPEEARNIDEKMDDGRPGTGAVIARSAVAGSDPNADVVAGTDDDFGNATPVTTACIQEDTTASATTSPTTWTYATLNPEITCSLRFKMN